MRNLPTALSLGLLLAHGSLAASRPNFLVLYADDQRWDALGVVQREQGDRARFPWLATPHLDRLASQSIRFRQSFVTNSLCSPGRACVLTGKYSHLNGITGNRAPLPETTWTFPQALATAGYQTAYFGKWHMGSQETRPGFQRFASFAGQGRYFDCPLLVDGSVTPTKGFVDDVTTDHAIQFLKQRDPAKPFHVQLGFKAPHGPREIHLLPERNRSLFPETDAVRPTPNTTLSAIYLQKDAGGERDEAARMYMRFVKGVDDNVGRILDTLDQLGLNDNTLVLFASDNGYYLGEHRLGDKRTAYDESLRVPLLIRAPGPATAPGTTNDHMVLNIDYAPTLLDYAGVEIPGDVQGRSLRPLLEGGAPDGWRTSFYYEYFGESGFGAPRTQALRTRTHKLIRYPGHPDWTEVFDLSEDPYETTNLAGNPEQAALRRDLETAFLAQAKAVGRDPDAPTPFDQEPSAAKGKTKKPKSKSGE